MTTTAHGLRDPNPGSSSGMITDVSYIVSGESAFLVFRSANYDRIQRVSREEARTHYVRARKVLGYVPCSPSYVAVETDSCGRMEAKKSA